MERLLALALVVLAGSTARAADESCASAPDEEDGSLIQVKSGDKKEVPKPHTAADPPGCSGIYWGNNNFGTNKNFYGQGDVWTPGNANSEACQSQCSQVSDCVGWTWVDNNKCYLKTAVCPMKGEGSYMNSGYCHPYSGPSTFPSSCPGAGPSPSPSPPPGKSCNNPSPGKDFDGHNNPDHSVGAQNGYDCKSKCESHIQCKGYTYKPHDGQCWLKDSIDSKMYDNGDSESGTCSSR